MTQKPGENDSRSQPMVPRTTFIAVAAGLAILAAVLFFVGLYVGLKPGLIFTTTLVAEPIELKDVRVHHNEEICYGPKNCIKKDAGVGVQFNYQPIPVLALSGGKPDLSGNILSGTPSQKLSFVREAFAISTCDPPPGSILAPGAPVTCTIPGGEPRTFVPFIRGDSSGCAMLIIENKNECALGLDWWVRGNSFEPLRMVRTSTNVVDVKSAGLSVYFDNEQVTFYNTTSGTDPLTDPNRITDEWDLLDPNDPVTTKTLSSVEVLCDGLELGDTADIICNEASVRLTFDLAPTYDNDLILEYMFNGDGSFKQKFSFSQPGTSNGFIARETLTLNVDEGDELEIIIGNKIVSSEDTQVDINAKVIDINTDQNESFTYQKDSEDVNNNGIFDEGEDVNNNGIFDSNKILFQNLEQIVASGAYNITEITKADSTVTLKIEFGDEGFTWYQDSIEIDPIQSAANPTQYKYFESDGTVHNTPSTFYLGTVTDGGGTDCTTGTSCNYRGGFQWATGGITLPDPTHYTSPKLKMKISTGSFIPSGSSQTGTINKMTTQLSSATYDSLQSGADYNTGWSLGELQNYSSGTPSTGLGGAAVDDFRSQRSSGANWFAVGFQGAEDNGSEKYMTVSTPASTATYKGELVFIYTCISPYTGILCT